MWRSREGQERIDAISPGDSFCIRADTAFQFRANAGQDLKLVLATVPPWPGAQEAIAITREWS